MQKNKVRPGVYQGKKGIPLTILIKTEVWENVDSEKQGPKTTEETDKTSIVKLDAEVEKKPIYKTRRSNLGLSRMGQGVYNDLRMRMRMSYFNKRE